MSKIIFFSYERMFYPKDMLSGPGARIWEMANALKRRKHKITIAQMKHEKDFTKNDIKFISWDPITLKNIGKEYDVAFIHLSAYSSDYFEKIKKIPTIVDLTTSLTMESQVHHVGNKDSFFLNDGILPTYNALQYGDFFICASEAQRNYYVGMMSIIGIKNYNIDNLEIVPYAPKSNKPIISYIDQFPEPKNMEQGIFLQKLSDGLEESKNKITIKLPVGSIIVVNNYFWLHGRRPFKKNKELRRELLRIRGSFFL